MSYIKSDFCFTAKDLYSTFNLKQLKIKRTVVQDIYGVNRKQHFCAKVFVYCCYLIVLDIIKNNVTFVLPLFNSKYASIYIKPIQGDEFKIARQRGAFKDVDFLMSNFTAYQFTFSWKTKYNGYRYKPIYISHKYKELLLEQVNKGRRYY